MYDPEMPIGIDLGTTMATACINEADGPEVVASVPAYVAFDGTLML